MQKKKILLVEDDANIRDVMKLALEFEGFEIHEATNGEEGLEVLRSGLRPELIILDLMMPIMNGWEFLKRFKESSQWQSIPLIIASAYSDKTEEFRNSPFLLKPIELSDLIQTVRKYIV